ncbi:MAG TPA: YajD family HNH nuclease [Gammaproteobacteria bacterium]
MSNGNKTPDHGRLQQTVATAQRERLRREQDYRERALKLYPWVCGRCGREFTRANLQELTVHHRDHDHDHNPADGSNWELLCLYCHDNEHQRRTEALLHGNGQAREAAAEGGKHQPFAALQALLKRDG